LITGVGEDKQNLAAHSG